MMITAVAKEMRKKTMPKPYGLVNFLWQLQEMNMDVLEVIYESEDVFGARTRLLYRLKNGFCGICRPDEPHTIIRTVYHDGNVTPAVMKQIPVNKKFL